MTTPKRKPANFLNDLSRELSAMSLKPSVVLRALPEWINDAASSPSGLIEIRAFIAKHFGLRIGCGGRLEPRTLHPCRLKAAEGRTEEELIPARAVATAFARIAAAATRNPWSGRLPSAMELRSSILARPNAKWVGLKELLATCWDFGVPVLYIPDIPVRTPKMDGMVTLVDGRPVIVITKKASHPAWALFVLAHEIGHIGRCHLNGNDDAIVDGHVTETLEDGDDQEREANEYALELLTGDSRARIRASSLMNAQTLSGAAYRYGEQYKIDPGHVVLNFAESTRAQNRNNYPLANAALNRLDFGSTSELCREVLAKNIDVEELPYESVQFMEKSAIL